VDKDNRALYGLRPGKNVVGIGGIAMEELKLKAVVKSLGILAPVFVLQMKLSVILLKYAGLFSEHDLR
jgi:hypothetical protein